MKVDRATMRCSMELRSPLQDYRVVEYSRLLPYEYQYGKYGLKTILKDILYEMVPPHLLDRPKRGFVPPTADWFRGPLKEKMLETVTFDNISTHLPELDPKIIINRRDEFCNENKENSRLLFTIFTYLNWLQRYGD